MVSVIEGGHRFLVFYESVFLDCLIPNMTQQEEREYVIYHKEKMDEYCPFCNSQLLHREFGYCDSNGARVDGSDLYCEKCKSTIPRYYSASSVFIDVQKQRRSQTSSKAKALLKECQMKRPINIKECLWRVYDLGANGSINYDSKEGSYEYVDSHNDKTKVNNIAQLIELLNGRL